MLTHKWDIGKQSLEVLHPDVRNRGTPGLRIFMPPLLLHGCHTPAPVAAIPGVLSAAPAPNSQAFFAWKIASKARPAKTSCRSWTVSGVRGLQFFQYRVDLVHLLAFLMSLALHHLPHDGGQEQGVTPVTLPRLPEPDA